MKDRIWEYKKIEDLKKVLGKKSVVLVGGCFDVFHFGHFSFLKKASKLGDSLIVALEPDEFIVASKKRQPLHTHIQRAEMLASHRTVNHVILLDNFTSDRDYEELVKKIRPNIIAVTDKDPHLKEKKSFANQIGGKVVVVISRIPGFSTSRLVI